MKRAHPANPDWDPTEGPGSGDDKYRFKPGQEENGFRRGHLRLIVSRNDDQPSVEPGTVAP